MGILKRDSERNPETVPVGWKTSAQWAKEEDLSHPHARRLIQHLVADGKWEMQKFRVKKGSGIFPLPHYNQKKQPRSIDRRAGHC